MCSGLVLFGRRDIDSHIVGKKEPTSLQQLMKYGFTQQVVLRSIECNAQAMAGDPLPGVAKHCICAEYNPDEIEMAMLDAYHPIGPYSAPNAGDKSAVSCRTGYTMTNCLCSSTSGVDHNCRGSMMSGQKCKAYSSANSEAPLMLPEFPKTLPRKEHHVAVTRFVTAQASCVKFAVAVKARTISSPPAGGGSFTRPISCGRSETMTGCWCFSRGGLCDSSYINDKRQCVSRSLGRKKWGRMLRSYARCIRPASPRVPNTFLSFTVKSKESLNERRSLTNVRCPSPTELVGCSCATTKLAAARACHQTEISNVTTAEGALTHKSCSARGPNVRAIATCATPSWDSINCNWPATSTAIQTFVPSSGERIHWLHSGTT